MSLIGHTVIYGGSFNPPHVGHQMACLYLLEGLAAEAVWVVPSWSHPFGKALVSYEHRLQMCRLMAAPLGTRVVVSTVERDLGGAGRTYDTLRHLMGENPHRTFALAVGADILKETDSWHRWDDIERMVEVAVLGRQGYAPPPSAHGVVTPPLPEVSSTDIRERVAARQPIAGLVPHSVAAYIEHNGLYGAEDGA